MAYRDATQVPDLKYVSVKRTSSSWRTFLHEPYALAHNCFCLNHCIVITTNRRHLGRSLINFRNKF